MHFPLLARYTAVLCAAQLGSGYAVIVTETVVYTNTQSSNYNNTHHKHYHTSNSGSWNTTACSSATDTSSSNTGSSNSSDANILQLPLSSNSIAGLNSLVGLITSIPDDIINSTESDFQGFLLGASAFLSNATSCITNTTDAIEQALSSAIPALQNITSAVGSVASEAVGQATSIGGDVASLVTSALPTAKSIAKSIESEVTSKVASALPTVESIAKSLTSEAGNGIATVTSDITHGIASDVPAVESAASGLLSSLSGIFRLDKRDDILNDFISTVSCISNVTTTTIDNSPVLSIARCALKLGELVLPIAKLADVKKLVTAAGGVEKTAKTFEEATSVGAAVTAGGPKILALFKEALGINSAVDDCKFLF